MKGIKTLADFNKLLKTEKVIVFIYHEWSGQAHISKQVILDWENNSQSNHLIFEINPEDSVDFDKWVYENEIHGHGYGSVIWLNNGKILGFVKEAGKLSLSELEIKTAEIFSD